MHVRSIIEAELEWKAEDFALWAFGEDYKTLDRLAMMNAWNEKHSDKLQLAGDGEIKQDLMKMIKIYRDSCDY